MSNNFWKNTNKVHLNALKLGSNIGIEYTWSLLFYIIVNKNDKEMCGCIYMIYIFFFIK